MELFERHILKFQVVAHHERLKVCQVVAISLNGVRRQVTLQTKVAHIELNRRKKRRVVMM